VNEGLRAIGLGEAQVMATLLVLARVGPLFALGPVFGSRLLNSRARALCAVGLSFGIAPVVARDVEVPTGVVELVMVLAGEVLVGLAFAYVVSLLFAAVSAAGSMLDTLIGFSYGSLVDPVTGTQASVLSNAYAMMAALIFLAIGGDAWVVEGLARTYTLLPAGDAVSTAALAEGARTAFSGIFLSAVQIAAPVMLALILTDVALGIVTRAVPQMNAFAVSFPVKIVVGLLVLVASLPYAGGWIGDQVQDSVRDAMRTVAAAG
jgi:flagellar biosynthesis protein FliR